MVMEAEAVHAARGSAYLSIQSLITTLMGAVGFAFIARILTQAEMGIAVGLLLILGVFQISADLGFGSGLAKHVAEYRGRGDDYTLITFVGIATKVSLSSLFAVVCLLLPGPLSFFLFKDFSYAFLFQWVAIDVFFVCVSSTVNKLLLGLNRFSDMAILSLTGSVVRQSSIVSLLIMGHGLRGLITGWILGDVVCVVLGSAILLRGGHVKTHPRRDVMPHLKKIIRFSLPLLLSDAVLFLYGWFDRAVLLAFIPLDEVAVYNVAYTAFGVLALLPSVLSTSLLPYFSEQRGKNMHDKIIVGADVSTRYIVMSYTPLALGLMSLATPILTLFAGEGYATGGVLLSILSLLGGVAGIGAAFTVLLLVYNMSTSVLFVNAISTGFGILSSLLLLQTLGSVGVALTKGLVMIMSTLLTLIIIKKRVSIKLDKETFWKTWCAALLMAMIVWLLARVLTIQYFTPLLVLAGGIVYLVALRILKAVKEEDIRLARSLMGRRAEPVVNFLKSILIS